MQKSSGKISVFLFASFMGAVIFYGLNKNFFVKSKYEVREENGEFSKQDMMDKAWEYEFEITRDPVLNTVPRERLLTAYRYMEELRAEGETRAAIPNFNWTERGPNNFGGRTRAIMIDPNDPTKKKVWAGSVGGGLWKSNDITLSPPGWVAVNDFFANIAVTAITFNPLNTQEFYFGTGEGYSNADAARGVGIWKSTDAGATWNQLASTNNSNFYYVNRLIIHQATGDIYAATNSGVFRSQNAGTSWTKVLGSGVNAATNNFSDIEVSSSGIIWASTRTSGEIYNSPTGNIGAWTKLNNTSNGMPATGISRIDFALAPSNPLVCYTFCAISGVDFYKTTDGGATWTQLPDPVDADGGIGNDITRSQSWYDMSIAVDPNNENVVWLGGIDLFKSANGGASWSQISHWYGGFGFQEVHADQHIALYEPGNSSVIYFGNDGGVWRSTNATASLPTISSRNEGYNVTQFYACAINPTAYSNQFLAGAQDNGSHGFTSSGINSTIEVTGGDGCLCYIDQNQSQYQFTSYVYNNYYRSTNGGQSFSSVSFGNTGSFVNPSDYDDVGNVFYAARSTDQYLLWTNPQTGSTTRIVPVAAFGNSSVRSITVSPNTANRVFFGTGNGNIVIVNNANDSAMATGVNIKSAAMPSNNVSCIAVQNGNDNHLLVTYSSYGVNSIWETTNALAATPTWTSVEGNVPDMPVRWALFNPNNSQQAVIATELGVWSTDLLNGSSTSWAPSNNGLANVRVTQLHVRASDNLLIASTHGRGLFSSDVFTAPHADFTVNTTIAYINAPVKFTDGSYQAQSWNWDFGDATTSSVKNPTHYYATPGLKTVTLTINNNSGLSLTRTNYIHILPDLGTPYTPAAGGDFETNTLHFGVDTKFGTPFQRGNSAQTYKNGTFSGSNAWVTGLSVANYVSNSHSILYAPDFNFSAPGTYTLRFYTKHRFETGWDGYRVEYSLDRGQSWNILGVVAGGWYDFPNTTQTTAFPFGEPYFNAQASSYILKSRDVSFLAGNSTVAFRFVFRTDASVNDAGVAIDNFEIIAPSNNPLPVQLLAFAGTAFETHNELYWTTATETNNNGFEILRSKNGRDFSSIGFTEGAGNSSTLRNYSFTDNHIDRELYYYRLKQIDFDGKENLSEIIAVSKSSTKPFSISAVSPNPFNDVFYVDFSVPYSGKLSWQILDLSGKVLVAKNEVLKSSAGIKITASNAAISSGLYLLKIVAGEKNHILKIVKE
jgi:PKD repeat protein